MVNHRANGMLGISDRDLGRPFQDLEVSYRPVELRSHLSTVADSRAPVLLREVEWRRVGPDPIFVDVHLVPLVDNTGDYLGASISFTDVTRARQLRVEVEAANRQLELAYEELQSTNEELETMNEELQSANDELQITNEQLRDRTLEITDLNAFMQSILGSLEAAVIVVDRDLVVQVWTRQAQELWGLRAEETVGQHLLNLDSGLPGSDLHPWLRGVITGQDPAVVGQELQAVNRRGRPVSLRVTVTPLQGEEGELPAGALILLENVSQLDGDG
jgi:two-component system CheB/CheR fusion protein